MNLRRLSWALFISLTIFVSSKIAPLLYLQDLSIYWKAAHNFVHGLNPYDLPSHTEYITGRYGWVTPPSGILKVWGAPITFSTIFPLGYLTLEQAKIVSLSLIIIFIVFTISTFSKLFLSELLCNTKVALLFFLWLLIWMFPVVYQMIMWGGVSWIMLPSLALSLQLLNSKKIFLAGLSLFPMVFKPQLLIVVICYVIVWVIREKRFLFILGAGLALLASILIVYIINPAAFSYYGALDLSLPYGTYFNRTTTVGGLLVFLGFKQSVMTMFGPLLILALVVIIYSFKNSKKNYFSVDSAVQLLPMSIMASPYSWAHDYILCLPLFVYSFLILYKRYPIRIFLLSFFPIILQIIPMIVFRWADIRLTNIVAVSLLMLSVINREALDRRR